VVPRRERTEPILEPRDPRLSLGKRPVPIVPYSVDRDGRARAATAPVPASTYSLASGVSFAMAASKAADMLLECERAATVLPLLPDDLLRDIDRSRGGKVGARPDGSAERRSQTHRGVRGRTRRDCARPVENPGFSLWARFALRRNRPGGGGSAAASCELLHVCIPARTLRRDEANAADASSRGGRGTERASSLPTRTSTNVLRVRSRS